MIFGLKTEEIQKKFPQKLYFKLKIFKFAIL